MNDMFGIEAARCVALSGLGIRGLPTLRSALGWYVAALSGHKPTQGGAALCPGLVCCGPFRAQTDNRQWPSNQRLPATAFCRLTSDFYLLTSVF